MVDVECFSHLSHPWSGKMGASIMNIVDHASRPFTGSSTLNGSTGWLQAQSEKEATVKPPKWQDSNYPVALEPLNEALGSSQDSGKTKFRQNRSGIQSKPAHWLAGSFDNAALIPGLPEDVAKMILALVGRDDFPSLRRVSKRWRSLVQSREYYHTRMGVGTLEEWLYVLTATPGEKTSWEVLNPMKGEWKSLPPMPGPLRVGAETVVINEKLLVLGGLVYCGDEFSSSAEVFVYDPVLDRWTQAASMSRPRVLFACGVLDGSVYVVGGHGVGVECLSSVEVYDLKKNEWTDIEGLRRARWGCFACGIRGMLYVMGGRSSFTLGSSRYIDVYDSKTKKWSEEKKGCSMVLAHALVNEKIYCIEWKNERQLAVYNPVENFWQKINLPLTSSLKVGFCMGSLNGKLFLFPTSCESGYDTLVYDPDATRGSEWKTLSIKPSGPCIGCATITA